MKILAIIFASLLFSKAISAQDWANLAKYRTQNEKLGSPADGEKRIVFFGDSITEGWEGSDPAFFRNKLYINRGIGGQTTPQMLIRLRQDVISLNPAVVVILAGTNDIAGNTGPSTLEMIEDNLASMSDIAVANGIRVVLCSVLPAMDYPWKKGLEPAPKIAELNKWIRTYSAKKGIVYLDYYSEMADSQGGLKAEFTYDGVHPNKAGYEFMAPLAEKVIAEVLKF
ncbi:MAG: SGNH/GDSL hydrolase family protein [Ignavibacteriales bacterium]|nr:SGNH/GDSL hydrolase family protein [Ignavibacteriales bacterium]MCF8306701.1 SGNH/GDSL hydrolase family protein [Ignavibacteriales bacterium]MCF8316199.1 SGNH/GDSL hydrolase family protein [Ignavibacteriales bacterium]MCF8437783.1 SGNH/GDSL hydrolase family protein [Ignavibacteriales bacterium]